LSHCFASFPAQLHLAVPPPSPVGFIEKPFYGFMLESHCQVTTPHLGPKSLDPVHLPWPFGALQTRWRYFYRILKGYL